MSEVWRGFRCEESGHKKEKCQKRLWHWLEGQLFWQPWHLQQQNC